MSKDKAKGKKRSNLAAILAKEQEDAHRRKAAEIAAAAAYRKRRERKDRPGLGEVEAAFLALDRFDSLALGGFAASASWASICAPECDASIIGEEEKPAPKAFVDSPSADALRKLFVDALLTLGKAIKDGGFEDQITRPAGGTPPGWIVAVEFLRLATDGDRDGLQRWIIGKESLMGLPSGAMAVGHLQRELRLAVIEGWTLRDVKDVGGESPRATKELFASTQELATELGLELATVEQKLSRYTAEDRDGCRIKISDRRNHEPRFLYRRDDVLPVLREPLPAVDGQSGG